MLIFLRQTLCIKIDDFMTKLTPASLSAGEK